MEAPDSRKKQYFKKGIMLWFKENMRQFPWRKESLSPYEVIIAEIMLQQTRANRVKEVYPKFIKRYSGWRELARADVKEIEDNIMSLGLHRTRAKTLKKLAMSITQSGKKRFDNLDDLVALAGVGLYVGRSVLVNCYGKAEHMLDVNMARILERYFGPRKLADIRYDKGLNELARELVSKKNPKEYNWAIMDFASLVCKSRNPDCPGCPISKHCKYNAGINLRMSSSA